MSNKFKNAGRRLTQEELDAIEESNKPLKPLPPLPSDAMDKMKKGGMTKMSSGGSASSRADGIAQKGKTKGTFVKMNKGGMSC